MPTTGWALATGLLWLSMGAGTGAPGALPRVLDAAYRADSPFPEYLPFWTESWSLKDASGETLQYAGRDMPRGGNVHVFLLNTDSRPLSVDDVLLQGVSLTRAVAFSDDSRKRGLHPAGIRFAELTAEKLEALEQAGRPVWWRIEPNPIPPHGAAELLVRLRGQPQTQTLGLSITCPPGSRRARVGTSSARPPIEGIGFAPALDSLHAYVSSTAPPAHVFLDGRDVTHRAQLAHDADVGLAFVEVQLDEPLPRGSFHCVQVRCSDGRTASAGLRAYAEELCYGMWGSRPGKEADSDLARAYLSDLAAHNINVQMEMVGSAAVREYLKTDDGLAMCSDLGLRRMVSDPGKGNTTDPWAFFLLDEPDCGDYRVDALPPTERVGSLAQALVSRSARLRETSPQTRQLLNVDMTFKPDNWYTYGQLPDILAADPYYQERLRGAYWEHPDRLPLYAKATYVYAVGEVCRSACAPKPLHLILNSVCRTYPERRFRYGTPEEKRIEVYYALAAGAKGISYWWYTPVPPCVGCGAQDDPDARALWREIGLLGAEVRTLGPLLVRSHPVRLPVVAGRRIWVRTLAVGTQSVVAVIVNDDYANDRLGTVYQPLEDAQVSLTLPQWLEVRRCFSVAAAGPADVDWEASDRVVKLKLGTLDLTRLVVLTSDEGLRARLQAVYDQQLSATTSRLLAEKDAEANRAGEE